MEQYRHTQVAYLRVASAVIIFAYLLFLFFSNRDINGVFAAIILALPILLTPRFMLTVVIKDNLIRLQCGIGFYGYYRKKIPLSEISSCIATKISYNDFSEKEKDSLFGVLRFGYSYLNLRFTPRYIKSIYRASGLDAVKIQLKSGKTFSIGTDEPEKLSEAIRCALKNKTDPAPVA